MIELKSLGKKYGDFQAVSDLSLSVKQGEMFGFLGPNGAGKTTTIRMLMGILVPTSGSVTIDSKDAFKERIEVNQVIGYLPDAPIFYDFLKGREILQFVGEMHGQSASTAKQNAHRLLNEFALADASEDFAVNYSMGMKKKLGLACALIHQPKILILDEPTNGLDPRASREVQNHLQQFAQNGGTVFLSTHLLDMAERLCSRVGVINQGKLVAFGTLDEIRHEVKIGGSLEDLFLKLTEINNGNSSAMEN
ncbi:MAG: ABC transporter ATP-binding protein [Bdellovibrionaceae bacterium]|nr:ABC transporter ATP-binding protein [Pseudobdellovibrionaceae bacterium]NUM60302.1 ABC transporter ATP-binding protein [Pseudobdellovibrionaceae bacterium]